MRRGRLDYSQVGYDDGSRIAIDYDQANTADWSYIYYTYDPKGTLVSTLVGMMALNCMCEQSQHPLACEPESVGKEGEHLSARRFRLTMI
jgi:hypothetical protein